MIRPEPESAGPALPASYESYLERMFADGF
jgi:hypothetical protein